MMNQTKRPVEPFDKLLFNRVFFRAVRRAMLENETVMRNFMNTVAVSYSPDKLERLDKLLVDIYDNDLFDVIMGNKLPEDFRGIYDEELLCEVALSAKIINITR